MAGFLSRLVEQRPPEGGDTTGPDSVQPSGAAGEPTMTADPYLGAVFDAAGDGIYVMGRDTRCTYLNPAGASMLGYAAEELVGRSLHEIIHHTHPDGRAHPIAECPIARAVLIGEPAEVFDDVFWHKGGWAVPVSYVVRPVVLGGMRIGAVVTFRDMTVTRAAEREQQHLTRVIEAERQRLTQIFEFSPSFMAVLIGPQHRFERVNQSCKLLWGRDRDLLGRTVEEAFPEAREQGFIDLLDGVYSTGETYAGSDVCVELRRPDGAVEVRWVDFVYQALRGTDGGIEGVFVQGVDLTQRKQAEAENARIAALLREQDRRKDDFIATLSHELRNPLAPLSNGLEILERANTPESVARVRPLMKRQLQHLVRLVDDLLDVSRINRGKLQLRLERVLLDDIIDAAVEQARVIMDARSHTFSISRPSAPVWLRADRIRLAQVFANLLNNAAKYTPPGGCIEMHAVVEAEVLVTEVRDTGLGIPNDKLETVFGLFCQLGGSDSGGLGIGLALAKSLVEMHGGTITAHSSGPGEGSTFTVRVPCEGSGRSR